MWRFQTFKLGGCGCTELVFSGLAVFDCVAGILPGLVCQKLFETWHHLVNVDPVPGKGFEYVIGFWMTPLAFEQIFMIDTANNLATSCDFLGRNPGGSDS